MQSLIVPAATTGVVATLSRKLAGTSVFSLLSGSDANLSIGSSTGALSATAGIADGDSETAYVREAISASHLAVEYPVTLVGYAAPTPTPTPTPTGLTAPTLTRTSGATTYPPLVDFNAPIDWQEGDTAVMQRSQDPLFVTGVSETTQTLAAATTTYNFGLSSIASGSWFMRMAAWHGATRPGSLNWSTPVNVGDVTAPTITSSATIATMSHTLTADELVTWGITGGAQAAAWQIRGATMTPVGGSVAVSVNTIIVTATDYAGNPTNQTITNTLDVTPNAFSFTDVSAATPSTDYTSNTITLAGLGSGVVVPVTITGGTYSKNGGAFTSAAGTGTNTDTFAVKTTSPSTSATQTDAVLTIGSLSDTFSVATPGTAWTTTTGASKHAGMVISGTPKWIATNTPASQYQSVRMLAPVAANLTQMQWTLDALGDEFAFGWDSGARDMSVAGGDPATFGNNAVIKISSGSTFIFAGYTGSFDVAADVSATNGTPAVGDIYTGRLNKATGAFTFYRKRGGVEVSLGGGTTTSLGSTPFALFTAFGATQMTANPGTGQDKALSASYVNYDGST